VPFDDPDSLPVVFSLHPDRARTLGWRGHVVDLTK
jgi:hypothetical protein